jgi:hypothetical protein
MVLMINVSHEQKKIKLQNKWHFVGGNRDYAACPKNSLLSKYIK